MTTEEPNHWADAIQALTAAARQTYRGPDGQDHRYDFGEVVCHVITTVAANLGGLDALLAGRPGSWEADHIRNIIESTVPEDQLLTWRTEPVRLYLNPVDALDDAGIGRQYQAAIDALSDEQADSQTDVLDALFEQDITEYAAAYTDAARQAAEELGITVPVHIEILDEGDGLHTVEPAWDILAEQLHTTARRRTPLPTHITDYLASTN